MTALAYECFVLATYVYGIRNSEHLNYILI